ncbi:MAG: GDSL-type esterase/lipase family protein [Synoicihabitans sp.]
MPRSANLLAIVLSTLVVVPLSAQEASPELPPGVITPINPTSVPFEKGPVPERLTVNRGDRIALIGSGLASRMNHFGHFETEIFLRFADQKLTIRNYADEGATPGFRSHSARNYDEQYAFPGAKELLPEKFQVNSRSKGHFETPDQWLTRFGADTIIAFFGLNSSFEGPDGVDRFKKELTAFIRHTRSQEYNGETVPQLALVSPTAFQDVSVRYGTPDGEAENANLRLYTQAMRQVARQNGILFVDVFTPTKRWFEGEDVYTTDGLNLTESGYQKLAPLLANRLFPQSERLKGKKARVHDAVTQKIWAWLNVYKIPNGVHAYGRRYNPFGPDNYPYELQKAREMTANRDRLIWARLAGEKFDLAAADAETLPLPEVETNYKPSVKNGSTEYLPGKAVESKITTAPGYKIELFADEHQFPDLANPAQMAFDNQGRLWVSTMASYPHYRIGDPLPNDKLLIFEDTDNDGRADKQITWADNLHIPIGFEITADGVYVSQSGSLVLLRDTDGDDKADTQEVLLSGFDDHDTHHAISAFCADPSGAIMMAEGLFSHTNVETPHGTVRGNNGAFYRYAPQRRELINYAQFRIPNPWGIAFDDYGQDFFLHTSGTKLSWMMPGSVQPVYGVNIEAPDLITSNKVRPTSGLEFVSSRHFPDEVQGDILLNNAIGFLGAKQHRLIEDGTGFTTEYRQDLYVSEDLNFRPVDLEFAPDGSLYVVDWHNALIGHMQHSARDPLRDHVHGRIYRVTYPSRPLVKPPQIAGASIDQLLENLKLPEYRARYRTRRELRGRDAAEVVPAAVAWAAGQSDERLKLEALWVTWGANQIDRSLVEQLFQSSDHRIRSAVARAIRFNAHHLPDHTELLMQAAKDPHGRVRLEAITAASRLDRPTGEAILAAAESVGIDDHMFISFEHAKAALAGEFLPKAVREDELVAPAHLEGGDAKRFLLGAEIYEREGHCATCHQPDGKGLPDVGFPPLAETQWAQGDPERLIKLTLKGLMGPIEVKGRAYPGVVPMTQFEGLLDDNEMAAVLTYVRNAFGNKASPIRPGQVKRVRAEVKDHTGMYNPADLLKEHPMEEAGSSDESSVD